MQGHALSRSGTSDDSRTLARNIHEASAAIAIVLASGAGPEASGDQKEYLSPRLVPLAPRLAFMRFRDEPS